MYVRCVWWMCLLLWKRTILPDSSPLLWRDRKIIPSFGPCLTSHLLHDIIVFLHSTSRAELALRPATCSVVVCVCVVNLMIVCEARSRLLCSTSAPREATAKREIIGRPQISHDDGKEQLPAAYVVQLQEQQSSGRSTSVLADSRWQFVHIWFYSSLEVI